MKSQKKPWRRTGLSRSILLTLEAGETTIEGVLARLADRPGLRASDKEITSGAVWVILERSIQNGLVASNRHLPDAKKPYLFRLTDGGVRRVRWIKGQFKKKSKPDLRIAANPGEEE